MKSAPAKMLTCVSKPNFERKIFSNTIKRFLFLVMIGKKCVIRKEITAEIFEKFRNLHGWGKRAQKHKVLFLNIIQIIVFLGDVFFND